MPSRQKRRPGVFWRLGVALLAADGCRVLFGTDLAGKQATLWIDRKPTTLAAVLHDAGVDVPFGWTLSEVRALSDDARVLVGNGADAQGVVKGYRVVLPHAL